MLHKNHHIANLILQHVHHQMGHCGRNQLIAKVRQKYWMPGLNRAARTVISRCITCRKLHAKPAEQKMADLLEERQRWHTLKRNFVPGDLVLIVDSSAPRNTWMTGRVKKTYPDSRGVVRRVQVQTKSSLLDRPTNKLCLLQEAE